MSAWAPEDVFILRKLYPNKCNREIAEFLGRSLASVDNMAVKLGLKKSARFRAQKIGCFRPGHQSWNKGLTGFRPGGRSAETRFRKGERRGAANSNWVPVGTEKVRGGLLCRKLTDDPSVYPAARWKPVHALVWEEKNGPVPPGHIAVFKPGKHTTDRARITPDVVEVITRAENMRRNSYHTRYPKEVGQLIQLKGALNRKINRRQREQDTQRR